MPRQNPQPSERLNYGICWSPSVDGYLLRLGRYNETNKMTGEPYPYHYRFFRAAAYGGKRKALAAARAERDKVLARPEFAAYLANKAYQLQSPNARADKFPGIMLIARERQNAHGGMNIAPEVRALYRRETSATSPRKLSVFTSFCLAMDWRDKKCGRGKRKPAEMRKLFEKFLSNNADSVRKLRAYEIPIWPEDLRKNKRA